MDMLRLLIARLVPVMAVLAALVGGGAVGRW